MKKSSKVFAVIMVVAIVAAMGVVTASATMGETDVTYPEVNDAFDSAQFALDAVLSQISIEHVVSVIMAGISASVGFFFLWFAVRWLVRKVSAAIKTGRLAS